MEVSRESGVSLMRSSGTKSRQCGHFEPRDRALGRASAAGVNGLWQWGHVTSRSLPELTSVAMESR